MPIGTIGSYVTASGAVKRRNNRSGQGPVSTLEDLAPSFTYDPHVWEYLDNFKMIRHTYAFINVKIGNWEFNSEHNQLEMHRVQ